MSRFFALPVVATVIALVGVRIMAASAPAEAAPAFVVSLPAQEAEAPAPERAPIVTPQDIWEAPVHAPAPRTEPVVIVLEALPAPVPAVRTEVVERTVYVPQTTVVYAPTNIYYPVAPAVEAAPEPKQEVIEIPVVVFVCPTHRRAGCCPPPAPKRPAPQQDAFFKTIPFLPATPQHPATR
jgi:hypothetical protein